MSRFESLYASFERDIVLAKQLESPNPEDTLEIKVAIVGFSYNAATEAWGEEEYTFTQRELDPMQDLTDRERLFYALGIGYLLGLRRSDVIDATAFSVAMAQLPGFMLLKGGAL